MVIKMSIFHTLESMSANFPIIDLATVVWCIYIGAVIGWAGVLFNKFVPGAVVRKILKQKLHSEELAKTPDEIGISVFLRVFLRDGKTLRRIVKSVEQLSDEEKAKTEAPSEEKESVKSKLMPFKREFNRSVKEQHFFIPEELRYRAENRYSASIIDILVLVIGAAGLLAVAVYLYNYGIPQIMSMVGGMIG